MVNSWYILQFKPNSHQLAIKNLNQQGFETFLPLQNFTSHKTSKFTKLKSLILVANGMNTQKFLRKMELN